MKRRLYPFCFKRLFRPQWNHIIAAGIAFQVQTARASLCCAA
jgi:hypothetical protein